MLLIYIPGYGCYSARQWWDTDVIIEGGWLITSDKGKIMSELKLNAIDFISFAVAGNTFKLKANLIGPNDQFHSVNLDIAPDEIKNKTIGEIEKLAIQALRSA